MTCPLMDDQTIEAFDFAKPCKDCGDTATVFMQQSHSLNGCWSPGSYRCTQCLDKHLLEFAQWLIGIQGRHCPLSDDGVAGGLEENTRVMPL